MEKVGFDSKTSTHSPTSCSTADFTNHAVHKHTVRLSLEISHARAVQRITGGTLQKTNSPSTCPNYRWIPQRNELQGTASDQLYVGEIRSTSSNGQTAIDRTGILSRQTTVLARDQEVCGNENEWVSGIINSIHSGAA